MNKLRRRCSVIPALIVVGAGLLLDACGRSETADTQGREYAMRGAVRGISPDGATLEIEHEDVPGYMPAMTMPFSLKDPASAKNVKSGDAISFRLLVTDKEAAIDQIQKIAPSELRLPRPTLPNKAPQRASARLRPGDMMPRFQLTNEQGEAITGEAYRGRPYVLTFIFTRCPVPTFCPLVNRNFGELQTAIKNGTGPVAETRLLSISFDPSFDTPAVLKETAESENADRAVWSFATGEQEQIKELTSRFSVHVEPEAGSIAHGLATALIDPSGRVVEVWRGNGWKPSDVLAKLNAVQQPAAP